MRYKVLIFLSTLFLFTTCNKNSQENSFHLKKGFILKPGIYYWNLKNTIIVKNIDNTGKVFAVLDKKRNVIYQQPITHSFSDIHYYSMFVDEKRNIYYYNSDIGDQIALIWNNNLNKYDTIKNFCSQKISLPKEFREEIQPHLSNCKSL